MTVIINSPPAVQDLNQKGLIERAFHDGLFPNLAFRAEAMPEEWPEHTGEELFITRAGLLKPVTKPLKPGSEPVGQSVPYEQWVARQAQWSDSIDTHTPTSSTASASQFLRNVKQLGLQAGQSINRVARNAIYKAYLSGQTVLIAAALAADTTIRVAACNGFTDVVLPSARAQPQPVSAAFPLPITLGSGGAQLKNTVIGAAPDDPNDPDGPGTLTLGAAVGGGGFASRSAVLSVFKPRVVRAAGGDSIDAIGAADTLTLQQCINAVAFLRRANVQPHDDGFYHCHISPLAVAQLFADPVFQRLNQSLPEHVIYKEGFIGYMAGIMFIMNTESPESFNSGDLISTASSGVYASDLGAETTNGAGVAIGRAIITGRGLVYEKWVNEAKNYMTDAGLPGKQGEFSIVNNGIQIETEKIRLYLRSPQDKLGQKVTATWSITTSFPVPSDITAPSGPERFKRAVALEFAL